MAATDWRIDALRIAAITLVVMGHSRALCLPRYESLSAATRILWALPYGLTSVGREAALFMFVVSGFLVGGRALDQASRGRLDFRQSASRRLRRVYPIFVTSLFVTLALDKLGALLLPSSPVYLRPAGIAVLAVPPAQTTNVSTLAANLVMLQGIRYATLGSNGALWFVAFLVWFWVLFGAGIGMLTGRTVCQRWVGGLVFLLVALVVGWRVLGLFPVFLLGAAAWRLRPVAGEHPVITRIATVLAIALVAAQKVAGVGVGFVYDWSTGVAGMLIILAVAARATGPRPTDRAADRLRRLAGSSYAVYCTNLPLVVLGGALYRAIYGQNPALGPAGLVAAATLTGASWLAGSGLAGLIAFLEHRLARMARQRDGQPTRVG